MNNIDLTTGNIRGKLISISIPLVLTSFVQMAYNIIDTIWISRLGSGAIASISTAGFYLWLASALILLAKTGTEINVSQKTGDKNQRGAKEYASNGIYLALILGFINTVLFSVFKVQLIDIYGTSPEVRDNAVTYMGIVTYGVFFDYINFVLTGIFIGRGNSKIPFFTNVVGLLINLVLDPFLIFGFGSFSGLGIAGAAYATTFAKIVITIVFLILIARHTLFPKFRLKKINFKICLEILKLGFFPTFYNATFCICSILLTIIISRWGDDAISASRVGSQVESISWLTVGGFSAAITSFIGQNYGAKKYNRVIEGFIEAVKITGVLGIFNTILLFFGARIFSEIFFTSDTSVFDICVNYLKILALCQLGMCIEITAAGVFNGIGKTLPPSLVSIILNVSRLPLSLLLAKYFDLNGIWWAITITAFLKGVFLLAWLLLYIRKNEKLSFKEIPIN